MSFGFAVGDIIAGATLAYNVCSALLDATGSKQEYHDTIASLNVVHKVLLQVEQLRVSNSLSQATLNALLFAVNSANDSMNSFLTKHQKYGTSFRKGGSGNAVVDMGRKVMWAVQMPAEVEKMRSCLNTTLMSIACLLQLSGSQIQTTFNIVARHAEGHLHPTTHDQQLNVVETIGPYSSAKDLFDPNFNKQQDPRSFYRPGQVFSVIVQSQITLTTSSPSETDPSSCTKEVSSYIGPIFIRRFLVVREGYDSCLCLGIHTYGGRGCADCPDQSQHAILYGTREPASASEAESGMIYRPVKMTVAHPSTLLSRASRIHFGKVYKILHSCQVRPLGIVDVESIEDLHSNFMANSTQVIQETESSQAIVQDPGTTVKDPLEGGDGDHVHAMTENAVVNALDHILVKEIHHSAAEVAALDELQRIDLA